MKPCLSQTITLPSSFAEDVANYADAGCTALEVWLPKIEDHLTGHSAADYEEAPCGSRHDARRRRVPGRLAPLAGRSRTAHSIFFKSRLDICQQFGIPALLVVADFVR